MYITFAWLLVIFLLSHQPGEASTHLSNEIVGTIGLPPELSFRTYMHYILYFILGLIVWKTVIVYKLFPAIMIGCGIIFAWLDEYTKKLVAGRHYELADAARNIIGFLAGIAFGSIVYYFMQSAEKKKREICEM